MFSTHIHSRSALSPSPAFINLIIPFRIEYLNYNLSFARPSLHTESSMAAVSNRLLPCALTHHRPLPTPHLAVKCSFSSRRLYRRLEFRSQAAAPSSAATNSRPPGDVQYTVGDFMTRKKDLHVVKPTTTVDEALEALVEKRVTGFPVIDEDWNLVGVVSDYDLLALDSISGGSQCDTNLFPDVNSSWKTFNEIQKLLTKTNGKLVGDLMTPNPLAVRQNTNLEDAARLLLKTKYRRLPVVDSNGKLVGIITRGNVVSAALQIKHSSEKM